MTRRGSLFAIPAAPSAEAEWAHHEYTCRSCGKVFHTVGGDNWQEPWRTTCGSCLTDPEPTPTPKAAA